MVAIRTNSRSAFKRLCGSDKWIKTNLFPFFLSLPLQMALENRRDHHKIELAEGFLRFFAIFCLIT
jgi:hypothetical protein